MKARNHQIAKLNCIHQVLCCLHNLKLKDLKSQVGHSVITTQDPTSVSFTAIVRLFRIEGSFTEATKEGASVQTTDKNNKLSPSVLMYKPHC